MPTGNKKKKKQPTNPARGVATTSIQSKAKTDTAKSADGTDASGIPTPKSEIETTEQHNLLPNNGPTEQPLHVLSPEEFQLHLEQSELQLFVEKYAAKVRKDAGRQVSKLQTEKRLLRQDAEFLSVKEWLPIEIVSQILEFAQADHQHDAETSKTTTLPEGDDLIAKLWQLRECLLALDLPFERVNEAISSLLKFPPADESSGQSWGVFEALDRLALYAANDGLTNYDTLRGKIEAPCTENAENVNDEATQHQGHGSTDANEARLNSYRQEEASTSAESATDDDDDSEVSDIDSDVDPSELLSVYLRIKSRLYDLNPAIDGTKSRKPHRSIQPYPIPFKKSKCKEAKLQAKLKALESDILFDSQEAEALWSSRKADLLRQAAQRRKLDLPQEQIPAAGEFFNGCDAVIDPKNAESRGQTSSHKAELSDEDDDPFLGPMFDAFPGGRDETADPAISTNSADHGLIEVRDFGKPSGVSPKRILEETCRARDPHCRLAYRQVSPTTYLCRHSVTISWSRPHERINASHFTSILVEESAETTTVITTSVATPDVVQSESYVATAALFVLTSDSTKEKPYLRLPAAYKDVWKSFAEAKREYHDDIDRKTIKDLRRLIDAHYATKSEADDVVVFNVNSRFRNVDSTPLSRQQTPRIVDMSSSQIIKDTWNRRIGSDGYKRMLPVRMSLPVFQARASVLETIEKHQISIIVGDTGSGKSTQLPQFILENELSQGRPCKIYCTEPRRISAMSLAYRVSEELGEHRRDFGTARSLVGYAVRLDSKVGVGTKLVYATVGIVLRMLESEDGISDVTHLCLDEVHERSIDSDFLLIILRSLLEKRRDLKVVLMSATVDAQKLSQYLNGAPIISVAGRTFPVEAKFLEDAIEVTGHTIEGNELVSAETEDTADEPDWQDTAGKTASLKGYSKQTLATLEKFDEYTIDYRLIISLLERIAHQHNLIHFSKAILVFVPGIAEIRQLHDILGGHPSFVHGWRIYGLHSTFSSDEQQAVFEVPPNDIRKIVITTNIAETGVTIPDVTCVIDTGKHREMRFDERRQISRLTQSFIARANAKQRRGRAGRVQEGICFHLFTRYRFETLMAEQQTPEMLRLSLQDLVMRVKICKLGDIEQTLSQALDPPSSKNIRRAIDALIEVGALTSSEQLTPLGRQLAKLPLDAQLGKLILTATAFGCLDFALTAAAAIGAKSPFLSPMHAKKQADSVRLGFKRGDSDLLTLYNAYYSWRKVCTTRSISESTFCRRNFLSSQNLANLEDIKAQLLTTLLDAGFVTLTPEERAALGKVKPGSRQRNFIVLPQVLTRADDRDLVVTSVVAWAFYPKIIKQEGKGWRSIASKQSLALHPTSVNKTGLPPHVKFLSFYNIIQTSTKFTSAQETSPVSDFALVLLAGEAIFHMYAGVIVVDGNRLRFKVRDWKTMLVLKELRTRLKDSLARLFKYPGRGLSDRQMKWMALLERIFEHRQQ